MSVVPDANGRDHRREEEQSDDQTADRCGAVDDDGRGGDTRRGLRGGERSEGARRAGRALPQAQVPLARGLSASAREGVPLSAKFEIDDGVFQLSSTSRWTTSDSTETTTLRTRFSRPTPHGRPPDVLLVLLVTD
jgi:hypothetical protein